MAKYLPLPDGSSLEVPDSMSLNEAMARAKQAFPELYGGKKEEGPKGGFTPALKAGVSGLKSDVAALAGKTGLMDEEAAQKYIEEQKRYQAKTFKPTEEGWSEAPLTKVQELLGGSLPYMVAPVAAGAVAPAGAAALGATGLASLAQFTGSNLSRQMDEGKTLKETELGSAAAAAIPQAALDVVSLKMLPGIRNIFGQAGKKMTAAEAKAFTEQGIAKIAGDYALATGKAMGTEGLTEAGQQFFERLQAGLNLTDDKARDEYWSSLVGGAVLGGVLSPAGRFVERGTEKGEAQGVLTKEKRKEELAARQAAAAQRQAEIAAEQARKQTPEYMNEVEAKYKDLLDKKAQLDAVADTAVPKGDLAGEEAKRVAQKQRKALMNDAETKALLTEYNEVQARRKALAAQPAQAEMFPETGVGGNLPGAAAITQAEQERAQYGVQVPEAPAIASVESALPEPSTDYAQQARALKAQIEPLQELLQQTTNLQKKIEIGQQLAEIRTAIAEAEKGAKAQGKSVDAQIKSLAYQMSAAEIEGDEEAQTRIAKKLLDLGVEDLSQLQAQGAFDLKATKTPFSESSRSFSLRTYPTDQRSANLRAIQSEEEGEAEVRTLSAEEQKKAAEARAAQLKEDRRLEIERMGELAAMDRSQTAQGLLFGGENLRSTQVSGTGTIGGKTRARLLADLQIARASGNRAAAAEAVAALKEQKAREAGKTQEQSAFNFAELQKAAGTQAPENVAAQQEATDKRDTAYANLVDLVSKFNQGKAKKEAVDRARDFLLENLAKDIETSRNRPLTTAEQLQLQNQANALLDDLVKRFGDTRNVSSVGTKRDQAFMPAQDEEGKFNEEAAPGMGYFTAESKGPGYRTFASPYAAAMSIQEGLDSLRNQGVAGELGVAATEVTRTPKEFTPEMVRNQLDRLLSQAPEKTDPEVRKRAVQIADNLNAFGKNIDIVSEYLSNPSPERTREVDALLADTERAKRSETETPKRETAFGTAYGATKTAVQGELPGIEATGTKFATAQEFDDYLAGDALDQIRRDQGLVGQTVSRLKAVAAPFVKKAEGLRAQLAAIQKRYAESEKVAADQVNLAKVMTKEAKANLEKIVERLDIELREHQIEYIQARMAYEAAVTNSELIYADIEANAERFTGPERDALDALTKAQEARSKVIKNGPTSKLHPKEKLSYEELLKRGKERYAKDLADAQAVVVAATKAFHAAVAANPVGHGAPSEKPVSTRNTIRFLSADLLYQMELQHQLGLIDRAGEDLLNAGTALELAKQKQDAENAPEVTAATSDVEAALQIEKEAADAVAAQKKAAKEEMLIVEGELADAEREVAKADTAVEKQRKQREKDQEKLYTETIYDREERDRTERRLENEMRERLEAIPGERLDFSKRREMMDVVDSARETEDEINQNIEDAQRALEQIAKNIEQQETVIKDSQITVDLLSAKKRLGPKQTVELERAKQNLTDAKSALEKSKRSKTVFEDVVAKGERGIKRLSERVAEIGKAFTNDPEVLKKVQASVNRRIKSRLSKIDELSKKLNSIRDVEKNKEKRGVLKHEIAKKKREVRELQGLVESERGLKRTTIGMSEKTLENLRTVVRNPYAPENVKDAAKAKLAEQADLAAEKELDVATAAPAKSDILTRIELLAQEKIINDPDATPQEQMAARDKIAADEAAGGPASRNLQARRKGPLVKDVRTGKVTQAGKAKPVTSKQAQRGAAKDVGFEQALLELDKISDLRLLLEERKEKAEAANDQEKLEKYAGYERSLDKKQKAAEKVIGKFRPVLRTAVTSTGPTLQSGQVTRIANDIVKDWAKVPNIEVVDSIDDLLPRIRDQLLEENGPDTEVPGLYDPDTDTVFLISSALRSGEDVSYTVMHEIAGHYGLRQMLGSTYSKTMNELYNGNKSVKEKADAKMADNKKLTREIAVEEVLADAAENAPYANQQIRNALRRFVAVIKQWMRDRGLLRGVSDFEINQLIADARRYVRQGIGERGGEVAVSRAVARTVPKYEEENELTDLAGKIIAQPKSFTERLGDNLALEFEMNAVDMRAGLREALKAGAEDLGNNDLYTQAMYSVTKADQAMPLISASLSNGPLELYQDARGLYGVRSAGKNSAKEVFEAIADLPGQNSEAKVALATTYMIAQRAANKGLSALDIGNLGVNQSDLDAAMARVQADPALEKQLELVRARYNAYNKGQIDFLASTGAIPKKVAEDLLKEGDYVPYYRVRSDGTAELVYGNERTITVGDIRHQPYLAELKGGDTKILPLNESIMRNTMLLTRKALTNMATKNVAYAMQDFGRERGEIDEKTGKLKNLMPIKKGQGPAGPDVIHFNQEPDADDPKDDGRRWLRVQTQGTAMEGIPAELVVKSLEGAHLTLPAFLKLGGIAGDLLRKGVTRMPMYIVRQLYRDPMAATFTAGLDYNPLTAVLRAGGEFIKMSQDKSTSGAKLMEKGLIQSNLFTGDPDDLSTFALQLASGKDLGAINRMFAFIDRASMRADAATRALVHDNAIKQGLSEVESDLMVMESMNFYKRGLSPTIQYANRLIPFMNAQIQGLNVLVKAARGNMNAEEVLQIKRKFIHNATLLAATGVLYAMAMDDDEYFQNAKPRDKYSNMFLHLPGVEEPMKIAIPYEAGWAFSAGVAMVDALREKSDGAQQWKAIKDMFLAAVPGYSSGFMPQAVKPVFEVWSNKNLFSGQNIEPTSVRDRLPEDRYVAATTEVSKALAQVLPGVSPIMIEHLARGYFGTLPIAIMASTNGLFRTEGVEPTKRASEMSLIGSAFQKKYGGADMDVVYDLSKEALQTKASFTDLRKTGTPEEVREFAKEHRAALAAAPVAQLYQTNMARLRVDQDRIRTRPNMGEDEKRARIDAIDAKRQELTETFMARLRNIEDRFERTTPQ